MKHLLLLALGAIAAAAMVKASECGGTLNCSGGNFHSPNYPDSFPSKNYCVWTIRAPAGSSIEITIHDFQLFESCSVSFLEIRKYSAHGDLLPRQLCGTSHPGTIRTTSNVVWVKFWSDASFLFSAKGFNASYVFDCNLTCINKEYGANLTTPAGYFTSLNYPNPYPCNTQGVWTIQTLAGSRIRITFKDFDVQSEPNCIFDYVEIRLDGPNGSQIGKNLCGTIPTSPILTNSNVVWVKFKSDHSLSGRGFNAFYDSECGETLPKATGYLKSLNYPEPYQCNTECVWKIQAPAGSHIWITFEDFDVKEDSSCIFDYVLILEERSNDRQIGHYLCGSSHPSPIRTMSSVVLVKFKSDFNCSGKGFSAVYDYISSTSKTIKCGRNLTALTGYFTSLNYPEPYPCNTECVWIIHVPAGSRIRITFEDFDVQPKPGCNFDYIVIRVGGSGGRLISNRLCGSSPPAPIYTMSSVVWVKFKSDHNCFGKGFNASYDIECGENLTAPTGYFTSLKYPEPYPWNIECVWTIQAPAGSRIRITFEDFDVQSESSCIFDYVVIRVNGSDGRQIGNRLCGNSPPSPIQTMSSMVWVKFKSDNNCSGKGFNASYNIECGENLTAPTGSFTSLNYPNPYPCNTECVWTIKAPAGRRIRITFENFDVKTEPSCIFDYIEVKGSSGRQIGNRLCGSSLPSPIHTMSNVVWVKFKSEHSCSGRGFNASYDTECGGNLTAPAGYFTFLSNHDPIPCNTECVWTIQGPQGSRIRLTFEDFDVKDKSSCIFHYVVVLEKRSNDRQSGIRLCGSSLPSPIQTMSNVVWIKYKSDHNCSGRGFNVSYIIFPKPPPPKHHIYCDNGFEENLNTPTGYFTSLNYPNPYPCNTECVWTIEASAGNNIKIIFEDMDIRNDTTCFYDYVAILVKGPNFRMIGNRRCGTSVPPLIRTMSSIVWVKFKSYSNCFGRGFNASYETGF